MSEHRAALPTLRRFEDPERSRDPQIIELLARLSTVDYAPAPRADFRAELRTQLVAIAPRIIAESAADTVRTTAPRPAALRLAVAPVEAAPTERATVTPISHRARPASPVLARLRGISLVRPLTIAASVVTVLALLLGGAVWQSQDSLPGDTLYGLKRASESFQLSTASSDSERAADYLKFAGTRVQEAQSLVTRVTATAAGSGPLAGGRITPQTASLVTDVLDSADADTLSASRLLGAEAVRSASGAPLAPLMAWAPTQLARLSALARVVPQNTELGRLTASSHSLVAQAATRAGALNAKVGCGCLGTTGTDTLGPLPCILCSAVPTPAAPKPGPSSSPTTSGSTASTPTSPGTTGGGGPVVVPTPPSGTRGASSAPGTTPAPLPPIKLPTTLPTKLPTLPPIKLPTSLPTSGLDLCSINLLGIRLCPSGTP